MPTSKLKEALTIAFNAGRTIKQNIDIALERANSNAKNRGANLTFNSALPLANYSNTKDEKATFEYLINDNTKKEDEKAWTDKIVKATFTFTFLTDVFGDKRTNSNATYDSSGNTNPIYLNEFVVSTNDKYGGGELLNLPLNYPYHHNRYEKEPYGKNKPRTTINARVFIFSKYLPNDNSTLSMRIIDLTDYLLEYETNLTHLGGTFTIKLAHKPIMIMYGEESYESYRGKDLSKIQGGYKEMTLYDESVDKDLRIRGFNFSSSENDIIFITSTPFEEPVGYNPMNIPVDYFWSTFREFDMIGLIDTSASITDYKNSNIILSGRDLSKLLMEDGTYWYQYSVTNGENTIFQNDGDMIGGDLNSVFNENKNPDSNRLADRIFLSGLIMQLTSFEEKSILNIMNIFIDSLSNIQICSDAVLTNEYDNF